MSTNETWLTTNETIAQLGVSDRTLRRYASTGRIKSNRVGKSVFYNLDSYIDTELEKAATKGELISSPFVAIIQDSRLDTVTRGQPIGIIRPSISFATRPPLPDGTLPAEYTGISFFFGSNLDKRYLRGESGFDLYSGDEWNQVSVLPGAAGMIESGVLKVFFPVDTQYGNSYRSYSQSDSLELIESTYGTYDLDRYATGEDRKVMLAAIAAKRDEIETQLRYNQANVIDSNSVRRAFSR